MRKGFYLSTILVCLGLAVVVLLPASPVMAQGKPPAADNNEPLAFGTLVFDDDAEDGKVAPGTCTFTCPDGGSHTTNAGSTIQCACDCASVCGVTCTVGGRTCSPGA